MALVKHGQMAGVPTHIAMRYTRQERMLDQVEELKNAQRRAFLARMEKEAIASGEINNPTDLFVIVDSDGMPVSQPMGWIDAQMSIWSPWSGYRDDREIVPPRSDDAPDGWWHPLDEFNQPIWDEVMTPAKWERRFDLAPGETIPAIG